MPFCGLKGTIFPSHSETFLKNILWTHILFFVKWFVVSKLFRIFARRIKHIRVMTQIVLNIEDASLVTSLKQILGAIKGVTIDRMITSSTDIEAEKAFITETITKGFHEAREGRFAGKGLKSLDALVEELRAEA